MNKPFSLEQFLPFRLNRLAAELSEQLSVVYKKRWDLSVTDWRVLATLAAQEQASAQSIVASTRTHKSSVSRSVARLSELGWLEQHNNTQDRRQSLLRLSAQGKRNFEKLLPEVLEFEQSLLAQLPERQQTCLNKTLTELETLLKLVD